jgi:hypothetical protein
MSNDSDKKKIILTEEQASRAAETLINAWLRNDDNYNYPKKNPKRDEKSK